jgi:hypothetical protein
MRHWQRNPPQAPAKAHPVCCTAPNRTVLPSTAAPNTWVYTSNNTNATYFWSTEKMKFTDAEEFCRARGAQLAAWLSAAEQARPGAGRVMHGCFQM